MESILQIKKPIIPLTQNLEEAGQLENRDRQNFFFRKKMDENTRKFDVERRFFFFLQEILYLSKLSEIRRDAI